MRKKTLEAGLVRWASAPPVALRRDMPTWGLDLNPDACAHFKTAGGRIARSLAELAAVCDAVLVPAVNAVETETVLFCSDGNDGLAGHLKPGSVVAEKEAE